MASVDLRDNLLGISWVDSGWVPILNPGNVLDYFSERSNPFYDRTCNNEVVKMQRLTLDHLNQMVGVEYILLHAQEPILYIIRKQQRQSSSQAIPLSDYYIIAGVVYQAPDLGSVIGSRVLSAVHGIQSAFDEAMSYCRYHPSKGYWWHFKDQEEREKAKPKSKKKEEPSSLFQRQRVDTLLLDLRQKFPPAFYQVLHRLMEKVELDMVLHDFQLLLSHGDDNPNVLLTMPKPGEKPIPVEVKKEPEPPAESVKQEEREPAAKTPAPAPPSKAPPEKRARLQ
ncbi:hypothetical protein JZ751_003102 [Albula glossodonta]|uniref:Mediator of RNA polymerase II transcription subunit 6 n=1 Tax=Albula glossodonta TaxID=121402 RepID=A0A8T2N9Y0_9TELE|nr:hypothetical protein JZ751_003102 [Albula glossodonta]